MKRRTQGLGWRSATRGTKVGVTAFLAWSTLAEPGFAQPIQPTAGSQIQPSPQLKNLRYDEDWTAACRHTHTEPTWWKAKCIPLGAAFPQGYVSVGGEWREWVEAVDHEGWSRANPTNAYLLHRLLVHLDFHPVKEVRAFIQLQNALSWGRRGGSRPFDVDDLDIHQAFVDVALLGANWRNDRSLLSLRFGRQEIFYAEGKLLSARDGANVRSDFDGVKLMARPGRASVDAFVLRPTQVARGFFDRRSDGSQVLAGVYASTPLGDDDQPRLDAYSFGRGRSVANYEVGTASEWRQSTGLRLWRQRPGVQYEVEGTAQTGRFGSMPIAAYAVTAAGGYLFGDSQRSFRALGAVAYVSGQRAGQHSLGSFEAPFAKGQYFGIVASGAHANVALHWHDWLVSADAFVFFRSSASAGLYDASSSLIRGPGTSSALYVGTELQALVEWTPTPNLTFNIAAAWFGAGAFLRETSTTASADILYSASSATCRW